MRRTIIILLLLGIPSSAFADLRESIAREAAAAAQARPNAPQQDDDNPYLIPAIVLMGAGGVVTLIGLTHETGAKCTSTVTTFSCGTTKSKATIFTGLGMVGVGAFVFQKGKSKARSPEILVGPHAVGVRKQLTW
jgi:hypothetical protein